MSGRKYEQAVELADRAEELVRMAERAVEDAEGYLAHDIAETTLQECLALQDAALEAVAPAIAAREAEVEARVREAVASLRGDVTASWHAKHRKYMSAGGQEPDRRPDRPARIREGVPMVTTNGSKTPIEQTFALLDAMDAESCELVRHRLEELDHARVLREIEHRRKLDKELNLVRSKLTAKAKSDYINAHGLAAYQQLPWE
jgi:hypothetical protein